MMRAFDTLGVLNHTAEFAKSVEIAALDQNKRYYTSTPELLASYVSMVPPVDDQK